MPERPAGPVVTIFRSRLRPDTAGDYQGLADRMLELASAQPGFVDFAHFSAGDGERVSIITFDSPESHERWRDHPEHREAQRLGRERYYAEYSIRVCRVESERDGQADPTARPG
ncbi:MAG TPA: antibiotic biosynthesis monooxygenase [Acidimicrobiales bacterium]|nr:antibiotic biosynthesis monooxygenase [Acidimicrobiales bacterium]